MNRDHLPRRALLLLRYAVDHSCADKMSCNAAISACGLASKWQSSLALLDFMTLSDSLPALQPSIATCWHLLVFLW